MTPFLEVANINNVILTTRKQCLRFLAPNFTQKAVLELHKTAAN
jgi:hypothetical protein